MLDLCTIVIFEQELLFGEGVGGTPAFDADKIAEIKEEKYEELMDAFIDEVFGYEGKLRREVWSS